MLNISTKKNVPIFIFTLLFTLSHARSLWSSLSVAFHRRHTQRTGLSTSFRFGVHYIYRRRTSSVSLLSVLVLRRKNSSAFYQQHIFLLFVAGNQHKKFYIFSVNWASSFVNKRWSCSTTTVNYGCGLLLLQNTWELEFINRRETLLSTQKGEHFLQTGYNLGYAVSLSLDLPSSQHHVFKAWWVRILRCFFLFCFTPLATKPFIESWYIFLAVT